MLPFIIGGVTLAAVGYAIKEICEEEGCPWEDSTSSEKNRDKERNTNTVKDFSWGNYTSSGNNNQELKTSKIAKEFHKVKKSIYKISMQGYHDFLVKHNIDNRNIPTNSKLEKQKLSDELINDELKLYLKQITTILESLSQNLLLGIKVLQNNKNLEEDVVERIHEYTQSIYNLSHLKLLDEWQNVNKVEISSTLIKAMEQVENQGTAQIDLDVK